jgi:hypothetical protein
MCLFVSRFSYLLEEAHILPGAGVWAGSAGSAVGHVDLVDIPACALSSHGFSYLPEEAHILPGAGVWAGPAGSAVGHVALVDIPACALSSHGFSYLLEEAHPTWSVSVGGTSWISCRSRGPGGYSSTCPIVSHIFIFTIRSTYPTWSGSVGGTVWISCWSRGRGGYSSTCPIPSSHVFLYLLEEAHILPGARVWAGPAGSAVGHVALVDIPARAPSSHAAGLSGLPLRGTKGTSGFYHFINTWNLEADKLFSSLQTLLKATVSNSSKLLSPSCLTGM